MSNIHDAKNDPEGSSVGPVAGASLKDRSRWPGFVAIAVGVFAVAMAAAAFAVGNASAGVLGLIIAVVGVGGGVGWLVVSHRRLSHQLGQGTPERPEDAGPIA
ncbi:hypothetical protein MMAD_28140 [Mycolicibacterium madagascariense]|uniref:UsfY protein n=1 Tax=Mycolicibacterium madagascariense TaxID=212765 RepID=A0A7I7XH53_9MYCO|nr:hypothetical protein [Mycolicibacterium madagascariense]MCV7014388.1 hypothetical protein [Mycolicibacterium madagascariense]BBZ28519.1 hypothetical protein MMAD_28140 [Mycolicibacterium madagascariense]